jgi:RNA polymerase sigma-70 factor (ECF subfamily)
MTDGFAEFYSANFQRVAAQLYAYVGSHSEAQDLTQEAFCRALDHWGKVSTYENGPAWVRQVAWNLATSRLRHLRVAALHLARQRMDHADGPNPDRVALIRALATLPHNHRTAVVLHYIGELSTSEIAAQCGVADGTVRSWLSRGRAELAERLVDWNEAKDVAFKPEDVATVTAKVKRRRAVRRTTIAAVLLGIARAGGVLRIDQDAQSSARDRPDHAAAHHITVAVGRAHCDPNDRYTRHHLEGPAGRAVRGRQARLAVVRRVSRSRSGTRLRSRLGRERGRRNHLAHSQIASAAQALHRGHVPVGRLDPGVSSDTGDGRHPHQLLAHHRRRGHVRVVPT